MAIELNLLIALLKTTKTGSVLFEDVKREARIASEIALNLLKKLQFEHVVYLNDKFVHIEPSMRMQLAIRAIFLGGGIEMISSFLRWQEFEEIAGIVLESNGYTVQRNLRFKRCKNRMEIDVVGFREPIVLCIDCKHWRKAIAPSSLREMVESQLKRTRALAESLPIASSKMICQKWSKACLVPVVLSLVPNTDKFHRDVAIVPILQLQDFVDQLPMHLSTIKHLERNLGHLS